VNFTEFLLAGVFFFFWLMALWIFVSCFTDIFRRDDLSGGMKFVWILFLFVLPLLGALIYILTRPKVTASDVQVMAAAEAVSKVSTADELAKLADLKTRGVIDEVQYEQLKAKILAS
jgi:predicted membrane channel-forming protein YqfA (hemolysin III family)